MNDKRQADAAAEVMDRKKRSHDWMQQYYGEFEEVFRNYKCDDLQRLRPTKNKPYNEDEPDEEELDVSLPDTLIAVRRFVARVTAQPPKISYTADDKDAARAVSRTLMWQWDKSAMQRVFKRNVLQAGMFGWSVIGFHWEKEEFLRRRRLDPAMGGKIPDVDLRAIAEQYPDVNLQDPVALFGLAARYGGSIPVHRMYRAYIGPKPHYLFIGDCFPEPEFETLQTSAWFIVERRRSREWLEQRAIAMPELRPGIAKLFEQYPKGTQGGRTSAMSSFQTYSNFRSRLRSAMNWLSGSTSSLEQDKREGGGSDLYWTITEEHCPGRNARLRIVGERDILIADMPYPFSLDGKIAFAETSYIPDLLSGIGDSTARLIRPMQKVRNRMLRQRLRLVDRISRPLIQTTDKRFFNNPNLLKRGPGMRIVLVDRPDAFSYPPEQAAIAAASTSMAQDAEQVRAIQMATGESNLSMMANVDPAQARTATGARMMQANMDVLVKSDVASVTEGIADAVDIMFLLNSSELTDAVNFEPKRYDERWAYESQDRWLQAHPYQFQGEGTLSVEAGSTLSDDDEANLVRAQTLWGLANQRPDVINVRAAAEKILDSMGESARMQKWLMPEQQPQPEQPKRSISLSARLEDVPPEARLQVLTENGFISPPQQPPPLGGDPQQQPPEMGPDGGDMLPPEMPNFEQMLAMAQQQQQVPQ